MKKIIIVGSIKTMAEREKSALSRSEFSIFTTTSAEEALEIHEKEKADLIISELELFGMEGDELCVKIRNGEVRNDVPFILLSYLKDDSLERCRACGASYNMTKPVDLNELSVKVADFLNAPVRTGIRVLTSVSLEGSSTGSTFLGKTEDISTTGMLITADKKMEKGDRISCSFFIGASRVELKGEIVRCENPDDVTFKYGVRFVEVSEEAKKELEEYIASKISAYA